jgi:hypothetical protein
MQNDVPFQDRPKLFWSWFQENEDRLAAISGHDDPFLDSVVEKLQEINEGLFLEVAINCVPKEFVITAAGDTKLFPFVDILASSAPAIDGWKFVALKPAMGFDFRTDYEGVEYKPKEMWFLPLIKKGDQRFLGLRIGIRSLPAVSEKKINSAVATILETGLGERAFAGDVSYFEVVALPSEPEKEGYMELVDLPRYIPWRKKRSSKED